MESMDEKKVIPAELPAGFQRDEAMAKVKDELEERGEKEYADMGGFDPDKVFKIDREIAQHFNEQTNELEVSDMVEGYTYLWARWQLPSGRTDHASHTEVVTRVARALGNKVPGYVLVAGPRKDFPECWHLRTPDGTRRIGDVQLYRVSTDVYKALVARQRLQARAQDLGVSANILARADRYSKYAHAYETEGDPKDYMRERAQRRGGMRREEFDSEMVRTLIRQEMSRDIDMLSGKVSVTRK